MYVLHLLTLQHSKLQSAKELADVALMSCAGFVGCFKSKIPLTGSSVSHCLFDKAMAFVTAWQILTTIISHWFIIHLLK